MKFKPILKRIAFPLLSACLVLVGCSALLPGLGIPSWHPAPAGASTAEIAARDSVPAAAVANRAAQIGELVPVASAAAVVVDRYTQGYLDAMQSHITRLEAQQAAHEKDPSTPAPSSRDWYLAMAMSAAAGASNLFSFKHGQTTATAGAAASAGAST